MNAEGHLRKILSNLNRNEHWDDGLRYAVKDAEEFLAEEFLMVPEQPDPLARIPSDPPLGLKEALELANELARCHAGEDGDCNHPDCPQLRDGEPEKTGRDCPLMKKHHPECVAIAGVCGKLASRSSDGVGIVKKLNP